MHKGIHRALRFGGGVRGVGACILVLFPQHDFYGGICGRREIDIGKVCVNICINRGGD